jgi:hypothetical protein
MAVREDDRMDAFEQASAMTSTVRMATETRK